MWRPPGTYRLAAIRTSAGPAGKPYRARRRAAGRLCAGPAGEALTRPHEPGRAGSGSSSAGPAGVLPLASRIGDEPSGYVRPPRGQARSFRAAANQRRSVTRHEPARAGSGFFYQGCISRLQGGPVELSKGLWATAAVRITL